MVDITRRKPRPILICELCDLAPNPEPTVESEDDEPEPSEDNEFVGYIDTVRKIQESLDNISFNLWTVLGMHQVRNVYTLPAVGHRLRRLRDLTDEPDELLEHVLSQGDNRHVEELLSLVQQNIIVNVNLSYYFKIMLVMLTVNTLLLVKCMVWDPFA